MFTSRFPVMTYGYASAHSYAWLMHGDASTESVDITNADRVTELGYDQVLRERRRRTDRRGIKHLYRFSVSDQRCGIWEIVRLLCICVLGLLICETTRGE